LTINHLIPTANSQSQPPIEMMAAVSVSQSSQRSVMGSPKHKDRPKAVSERTTP
jgi:hypothetical protein